MLLLKLKRGVRFAFCIVFFVGIWLTSPLACGATYGPVRQGETLWHIAKQLSADHARSTTRRMAVALWTHNRAAFKRHNMYGLMAWTVLKIPEPSALAAVSEAYAQVLLTQHRQTWQQWRAEHHLARLHQNILETQHVFWGLMQSHLAYLHDLQGRLLALRANISLLNHAMLQQRQPRVKSTLKLQRDWLPMVGVGLGAICLLGLLIFLSRWWRCSRLSKTSVAVTDQAAIDQEGEYDFLASKEGVAAQLDLARAYIAMHDITAAKQALRNVLKQGDDAQRQQAEKLLSTLK